MRRRSLAYAALFLSVIGTACADNKPTGPLVEPSAYAPLASLTLGDYIQEEIFLILPRGFENVVDARWATVRNKKHAGDFAGAAAHLATLVDWMDKKTSEATPPLGETKEQAVARLVLNMMEWLYGNENAPPHEPITNDVVVQVIPAGQSATVVVPSDHAGFDAGPQPQTEIVVISQESEALYPGQCNGPLATPRCQVPLFYKYDIQPNTGFVPNSARFAVCMIGGGSAERRPLDYLEDEATFTNPEDRPVHHRMQLAHEAPADPNDYVQGGVVEGNVEFLPKAPDQKGFVHCDAPSLLGMSPAQRALHLAMRFVGRIISPKDVYAYDSGPEHLADAASHFNGADRYSQQDLSTKIINAPTEGFDGYGGDPLTVRFSVANWSRRHGGFATGEGATAASSPTKARLYLFDGEGAVVKALGEAAVDVAAMRPDVTPQEFPVEVTLPTDISLDADYFIGSRVDVTALYGDVNTQNNTDKKPIHIRKKKPDLAFGSPSFTLGASEVTAGNPVTTSAWTVKNIGNAATPGSFTARFYLVQGDASTPLGDAISYSALGAGGSSSHDGVSLAISADVAPGEYSIVLKLDPANGVAELDESNNSSSSSLTVKSAEVQIALNLTTVEKLPGGTQHFSVVSGSAGPYTWSVNGTNGGSATFGLITTNTDYSAEYTAPSSVPTPATFDVCALRAASPTNKACASMTIKPVPSSGADVIVFNDLNMFDNINGGQDANNRQLFTNLVTYMGPGPRATQTRVWVHRGHSVRCNQPGGNTECNPSSGWSIFENTMRAAGSGYTVNDVDDATGPLTAIPANVKVVILALPMTSYSVAEINSLKQFSADGGRIVFVGEWDLFYGVGLNVENDFLTAMGAVMRNTGGAIDCGRNVIPASSLRSHQVTTGLAQLTIACASVVAPGPNDYVLFYDKSGTQVLGAVAKVDVTPLPLSALVAGSSSLRALTQSSSASIVEEDIHSWGIGPLPPAALQKP